MVQGLVRQCAGEMIWNRLEFVIPGTETSLNPLKAFKQGLSSEPSDQVYDFSKMTGLRCHACGYLELCALEGHD